MKAETRKGTVLLDRETEDHYKLLLAVHRHVLGAMHPPGTLRVRVLVTVVEEPTKGCSDDLSSSGIREVLA
jgi:hypothetical protein